MKDSLILLWIETVLTIFFPNQPWSIQLNLLKALKILGVFIVTASLNTYIYSLFEETLSRKGDLKYQYWYLCWVWTFTFK